MAIISFEFPTADRAADFFERVDGVAKREHRVVDVERVGDEAAVRALAAELGGKEA